MLHIRFKYAMKVDELVLSRTLFLKRLNKSAHTTTYRFHYHVFRYDTDFGNYKGENNSGLRAVRTFSICTCNKRTSVVYQSGVMTTRVLQNSTLICATDSWKWHSLCKLVATLILLWCQSYQHNAKGVSRATSILSSEWHVDCMT
jgi:hypothetical protein